jgi:hypothetical protein
MSDPITAASLLARARYVVTSMTLEAYAETLPFDTVARVRFDGWQVTEVRRYADSTQAWRDKREGESVVHRRRPWKGVQFEATP